MTRIEFAPEVVQDFDRITHHLREHESVDAETRADEIIRAIDVLASNPHIGRPLPSGMRELIIGRRSHGYVALYRFVTELDCVIVLAVRSQREAGHSQP